MAARVTVLEIFLHINARLPQFVVRHEVAAGGIDVSENKILALQIGQRMDGGAGGGDEQRVEIEIARALHQGDHAILFASLHVRKPAQVSKVERAVPQSLHRRVVVGWDYQVDITAHLPRQIIPERRLLLDRHLRGSSIGDHAHGDRSVARDDVRYKNNDDAEQKACALSDGKALKLLHVARGAKW